MTGCLRRGRTRGRGRGGDRGLVLVGEGGVVAEIVAVTAMGGIGYLEWCLLCFVVLVLG